MIRKNSQNKAEKQKLAIETENRFFWQQAVRAVSGNRAVSYRQRT